MNPELKRYRIEMYDLICKELNHNSIKRFECYAASDRGAVKIVSQHLNFDGVARFEGFRWKWSKLKKVAYVTEVDDVPDLTHEWEALGRFSSDIDVKNRRKESWIDVQNRVVRSI